MTATRKYLRGAFIAYDPGGYPNDAAKKRVLPFRFNPEGLSRSITVEQAQGSGGTQGAGGSGGDDADQQSADSSSGTLKETLTVQIRLDLHDRHEASRDLDAALGILPEIAALEDLLYPAPSETQASSDAREPVQARAPRPTVLLVWGRKRVYPVRITGMTINETMHNAELYPTRALVDVQLEVLSEADAKDNQAVTDALKFTGDHRRRLARDFLDRTASQNTNILPL
ncbi:MAG: hypothetical protein AAFV53_11650 [Myxococcota bacterium]